jgi:NADP-dependent 3-hydroxy acid dehydrogenase YdfG
MHDTAVLMRKRRLDQETQVRPLREFHIQPVDVAEMVVFLLKRPDNIDLPELIARRFSPK